MTKLRIAAITASRLAILFLAFLLLPAVFLIYVISLIAETYLTSLFSFVSSTKTLLSTFEKQLNETNEPVKSPQ